MLISIDRKEAWDRFKNSGKVQDYLIYKQVERIDLGVNNEYKYGRIDNKGTKRW